MHRYSLIFFCWLTLLGLSYGQLDLMDKVLYEYSAKIVGDDLSPESYVFYEMNFSCGTEFNIKDSEIPFTDYVLDRIGNDMLLAEEDGLLIWKGMRGKDPIFEVPDRYIQFIGGVPLFNVTDPVDFNSKGTASFFLELNVEDLSQELSVWAMIMEYEKIKCNVSVNYETEYLGTYTAFGEEEEEAHLLTYDIQMVPAEFAAKKQDNWVELKKSDHPSFERIMSSKLIKQQKVCNLANPLGMVIISEEPEIEVSFLRTVKEMELPECTDGKQFIYVYPNPTFGKLSMELTGYEKGTYGFGVYNVAGKKMWETNFQVTDSLLYKQDIELPDMESGLYLYNIINDRGAYLQSRRLVIIEQ